MKKGNKKIIFPKNCNKKCIHYRERELSDGCRALREAKVVRCFFYKCGENKMNRSQCYLQVDIYLKEGPGSTIYIRVEDSAIAPIRKLKQLSNGINKLIRKFNKENGRRK